MIKIENIEVMGWEAAIRGMRNPMNSWDKSDSGTCGYPHHIGCANCPDHKTCNHPFHNDGVFKLGKADYELVMKLVTAGTDHRKFMRMITVYMDITAPLYWWKEFDTYKVGTVANSCSTMHKIAEKEFTMEDFSNDHLLGREDEPFMVSVSSDGTKLSPLGLMADIIKMLNGCREKYIETKDKKYWWQMIQLLPTSYNQRRTVMLNYEVLANIYKSRKNHKLDEWIEFCKWIESLPYSEIITGENK